MSDYIFLSHWHMQKTTHKLQIQAKYFKEADKSCYSNKTTTAIGLTIIIIIIIIKMQLVCLQFNAETEPRTTKTNWLSASCFRSNANTNAKSNAKVYEKIMIMIWNHNQANGLARCLTNETKRNEVACNGSSKYNFKWDLIHCSSESSSSVCNEMLFGASCCFCFVFACLWPR